MDHQELELLNDYKYRNYSSVIEKALRNFESSSEWADLISSLGKLNKILPVVPDECLQHPVNIILLDRNASSFVNVRHLL